MTSPPRLPDFAALAGPIAVVAHDAGAANLLFGWLRHAPIPLLRPHMAGPAAAIWATNFPDIPVLSLDDALDGAKTLLSGTGWSSDLEHRARLAARKKRIASIATLDHWVNYRARFMRDGVECLPDRLWVGDEYALAAARDQLPEAAVDCWSNMYVADTAARVFEHDNKVTLPHGDRILYALEPIRLQWGGNDGRAGEFQALDFFMTHRRLLGISADAPVRLRPHPSDAEGKYDIWVANQGCDNVALAPEEPIERAVSWSTWIAGCESFVLLLGLAAGRRAVSTLPPWGNPLRLPHQGITRLSSLVGHGLLDSENLHR